MTDVRVALLRGINVGRAKRVAMADLRTLVKDLGYERVRTVLNSGNVVFTVPRRSRGNAAERIAQALETRFEISARVAVLEAAEVAAAIQENPLTAVADNPSRLLVLVLADAKTRRRLAPILKEQWAPEAIALGTRVAYLWCPLGVADSKLGAAVSKVVGDVGTARNMATMMKLHALCDGE